MKYILLAYILLFTNILPLAAQEGGAKAKMIIILDASGSMTEKIEGNRTKIDIAKQVVGDLIRNLDPHIDVGFMVYGHRAKGDCDDIELMVPPEVSDHEMILKRLAQIQPKGRTPICRSVEKAAEALRYTEDKASVVIVTDGEETCGGDPCSLGKKLRDTGVDFRAHIVGFGLAKGEGAGLKCLANETKGMFLEARDTATLSTALNATVQKVVQSESTSKPQPSAAVSSMGNLKVSVYQTDGGQPILSDVVWTLIRKGNEDSPSLRGYDAEWATEAAPGDYLLKVEHGAASATVNIKIEAGKTLAEKVVLGSGVVRLSAVMKQEGSLVEKDVTWEIGTTDVEGEFTKVATSYDGQVKFVVPAGAYQVRCIRGEATATTDVTVQSGQTVSKTVSLNAAVLDLVPQTREGGQLKDISWEVFGEANGEDDRKKIATSYDSMPHLYLPAGKYLVTWEANSEKGSADVEVAPGEAKRLEVSATR
jgi:Ca-activated chloride channel family protein